MSDTREVIHVWTHLQIQKFEVTKDKTPESVLKDMVTYLNAQIGADKPEHHGELVRIFGGYAIIGTLITKENYILMVQEMNDLNKPPMS